MLLAFKSALFPWVLQMSYVTIGFDRIRLHLFNKYIKRIRLILVVLKEKKIFYVIYFIYMYVLFL